MNKPSEWYFFSKKLREIKRKKKIVYGEILERFKRLKKKGPVVAEFYHKQPEKEQTATITQEFFTIQELGNQD